MSIQMQSPRPVHWLLAVAGFVTVLGGGLLYGKYSQRWGPQPDLVTAGRQLAELPARVGSWKLAEDLPMEKSALEMLECAGYVHRRYVDEKSGVSLNLAVIVGPPGPTAVHTPEICFSSRAYDIQGERQAVTLESSQTPESDTFWTVDFRTRNPFADRLRVYYAWSDGGHWKASKSPRFEFAAKPLLFKLQLAAPVRQGQTGETTDPGLDFLDSLHRMGWRVPAAS